MTDDGFHFTLHPGNSDERGARYRLIEAAWRVAYAHIYSRAEIDGVFNATISSYGDWVDRRKEPLGHVSANVNGKLVGFISLARLKIGEGEVSALYILPEYQGHGVGTALWEAGCIRLRDLGCPAVWVWALARANAVKFYEKQGCVRMDEGSYSVGEHLERAVGFRLALPTQVVKGNK